MAYFRVEFKLGARTEAILGVLSDHDGKVFFCADDVARFIPASLRRSTWLPCRPLKDIVLDPRYPYSMLMMAHRDVLDTLRNLPWSQSKQVARLLQYGFFRDSPYDHNLNLFIITNCEWGEGIQFPEWIEEFQKHYGPK